MFLRQSGATTFHLKDSDDWFLHTSAGQEFQRTLPFCQDELEHLRRTWASLSQWSEWCLHTGDLTDVSLALNVLVCNDGQPALHPLFWALVHQLLHQLGLDNDNTSWKEKAVICLWTAIAVRACLEWQCSLCAVYAHSRRPREREIMLFIGKPKGRSRMISNSDLICHRKHSCSRALRYGRWIP